MSDDDRYRRFNLRIPKELFAQLQEQADARSHSMNAEILHRLEESFEPASVSDIVSQYAPYQDTAHALSRIIYACDTLERAEEVYRSTIEDEDATELDRALSKHEVNNSKKHLDILASRASKELSYEERRNLPARVLRRLGWNNKL